LVEKLLLDHRICGHGLYGRRWFSLHVLKTTVTCLRNHARRTLSRPIHAHDVTRIECSRASRAFLTGFHLGGLSRRDHDPLHRMRADGTVNKCLSLVFGHRLADWRPRLRASLNVHASSFLNA
jgi:hypothetical protein